MLATQPSQELEHRHSENRGEIALDAIKQVHA
jgi:hypothetical protein